MPKLDDQSNDPFWETYKATLDALHSLGIKIPIRSRLPIFRLYTKLEKMEPSLLRDVAMWKLTELRELMVRGYEPKVRFGRYD